MATLARADERHAVSTLELFFDLVFVFAITQVTAVIAADPTAVGVLRGVLLLALVYWSWVAYSWLGTSARVDDRAVTAALLGAMAAMFVVAILLPRWFDGGAWAIAGAVAYAAVRIMHLVMFYLLGSDSPELRRATGRLAVSVAVAVLLLIAGALIGGGWQVALVCAAVVIDPLGVFLGKAEGWYLSADHFAERHGLIVIIALGESLIALGLAVSGATMTAPLVAFAIVGALIAALVFVLYFRRTAPGLLEALEGVSGAAQARLGRDVFSYGHFLLIAGIVALALGLKKTVAAIEKYGLGGELYGIAGPALMAAAVLVVGGLVLLRIRSGLGVPGTLAIGGLISLTGGAAALAPVGLYVPVGVFTLGLVVAVWPARRSGEVAA